MGGQLGLEGRGRDGIGPEGRDASGGGKERRGGRGAKGGFPKSPPPSKNPRSATA